MLLQAMGLYLIKISNDPQDRDCHTEGNPPGAARRPDSGLLQSPGTVSKNKKFQLLKADGYMKTITRTKYLDRIIELNGTPDIKIITGIMMVSAIKINSLMNTL